MVPDVYYWKAKAENYVRSSGLNYAIIRPTQLVGEEMDQTLTEYEVGKGDTLMGKISRYTLAKTVFDAAVTEKMPPQVTFECTGTTAKGKDNLGQLQPDLKRHQIHYNYRLARNTYRLVLLGLISLGVYYLFFRQDGSPTTK